MANKARPSARAFRGQVVQAPTDALAAAIGIAAATQIWFPRSKADVATAVRGLRNVKTLVKSGLRAAPSDAVDAAGGVVLHLASLNQVSVKGDVIAAEPATTSEAVVDQLVKSGLALPLPDGQQKSIASSALDTAPSCLIRTLGPLSDYVTRLTGVTPAGQTMTRTGAAAVERMRDANAVITGLTLKPVAAKKAVDDPEGVSLPWEGPVRRPGEGTVPVAHDPAAGRPGARRHVLAPRPADHSPHGGRDVAQV
jgi:hypothetical protein